MIINIELDDIQLNTLKEINKRYYRVDEVNQNSKAYELAQLGLVREFTSSNVNYYTVSTLGIQYLRNLEKNDIARTPLARILNALSFAHVFHHAVSNTQGAKERMVQQLNDAISEVKHMMAEKKAGGNYIEVSIESHEDHDKSFPMDIGELRVYVDRDDVDESTVDAMVETIAEVIVNNWDQERYISILKKFEMKRWEEDEELREEYESFNEYFKTRI